jgi:hypothetical protein
VYFNPQWKLPAIGVGSFVAGLAAGWTGSYFRSKKMISDQHEIIAEQERLIENYLQLDEKLNQVTEELRRRTEKAQEVVNLINTFGDKPPIIDEMKETLDDGHPSKEGWEPLPQVEETPVVPQLELVKSIFPAEDERPGEWNQEAEDAARQQFPGRPYIISYEEFADNSFGFNQQTLTFYEGDETLADQNDVPIYNPGENVGIMLFGKGSGDPNIVYVRNKKMKVEYEIIRDTGHFAQERLGLEYEEQEEERDIKHSATRRFRAED